MKFLGGLHTDNRPVEQPTGTWRDAKNILLTEEKGVIRDDKGISVYSDFPIQNNIIGVKSLPNGDILVFSNDSLSRSYIGRIVNGVYENIIVDSILNFTIDNPIQCIFRYNQSGELIVMFIADNITPKIINIDDLGFPLNTDKSFINDSDINYIELFPDYNTPNSSFTVNNDGGILKSGVYYFAYNYIDTNNNETNYTSVEGPVSIVDDRISNSFENYDGVEPNSPTSKSIIIELTNVETRYEKLQLVVIEKIDGVLLPKIIKKVNINSSNLTISYTGTETFEDISFEELLIRRPKYLSAKTITSLNDVPYLGNLTTREETNLQSIANNLVINYTSKLISVLNLEDSHKLNNDRGFLHDCVYAFYLKAEYKDGSPTQYFHIPGRLMKVGEDTNSTIAGVENITAKKFQVEDTSNSNSQTYTTVSGLTRVSNKNVSNMGFWENATEVYPDSFPDFSTQKVRHHKFPSIKKCKDLHYNGNDNYGVTEFDVLGIEVSNIVIPENLKQVISKLQISYAKRDLSKSNIVAQDILLYSASTDDDADIRWSTGGNWNLDAQQAGSGVWDDMTMEKDHIRLHSFDLLLNKPSISPSYISPQLKLVKSNLNATVSTVGKAGGKITTSGSGRGRMSGALIDYTDVSNTLATSVSLNDTIKSVSDLKYLTHNILNGNLSTRLTEECVSLKITNPNNITLIPDTYYTNSINEAANRPGGGEPILNNGQEETYLINICQIIQDMYSSVFEQDLVHTDLVIADLNSTISDVIYGGDIFVSYYSFITSAPMHGEMVDEIDQGIRIHRAFICETGNNANLRHEIDGNSYTKYYPKTPVLDFWDNLDTESASFILETDRNINELAYNSDYTSVNDLNSTVIFDPSVEFVTEFRHRVIRGRRGNTEGEQVNWRYFLPTDYYEQNTNRGEIINIQGYNDRLLIHHEFGLFITLGKEKLLTSTLEVTLGQTDIFSVDPRPVNDDELGYIGTQHTFSCFVTPMGYVSVDADKGHIHILGNNGLRRISDQGMFNYFRDTLDKTIEDNPYNGQGIFGSYDIKTSRLFFSIKKSNTDYTQNVTISYTSLIGENGAWVSFHSYLPDFFFRSRNNLFSIRNNTIYQHNDDTNCIYYDGIPAESFIEVIFNQLPTKRKMFIATNWYSQSDNNYVTFDFIEVKTEENTTGKINLIKFIDLKNKGNVRESKDGWFFNMLRTSGTTLESKNKLFGHYLSVKLYHNNSKNLDNSQNTLYLYNIDTYISQPKR